MKEWTLLILVTPFLFSKENTPRFGSSQIEVSSLRTLGRDLDRVNGGIFDLWSHLSMRRPHRRPALGQHPMK